MKHHVTADDRELARYLLTALEIPSPTYSDDQKAQIETVAMFIAMLHERAVLCATVRVEREFLVKPRKEGVRGSRGQGVKAEKEKKT